MPSAPRRPGDLDRAGRRRARANLSELPTRFCSTCPSNDRWPQAVGSGSWRHLGVARAAIVGREVGEHLGEQIVEIDLLRGGPRSRDLAEGEEILDQAAACGSHHGAPRRRADRRRPSGAGSPPAPSRCGRAEPSDRGRRRRRTAPAPRSSVRARRCGARARGARRASASRSRRARDNAVEERLARQPQEGRAPSS